MGRLSPRVTLAQTRSEMDSIARHLAVEYPEAISVIPMKEDIVGNVQPILLALLGACGFLLSIACANVASLLLARSIRCSGEFALRAAIGAGSGRIIVQLLTESLVIAGLGGTADFLLAFFGTKAIVRMLPATLPPLWRYSN